jgi:tetratricopeptide (TPR) repeat protein
VALIVVAVGWVRCAAPPGSGAENVQPSRSATTQPTDEQTARQAFDLRMAGKFDEARRVLDQALTADRNRPRLSVGLPTEGILWFESARLHFCSCEFGLAQKAIDKATQTAPENARYHYWAGQIATFNAIWKTHNPIGFVGLPLELCKARHALERAVALQPDFHEARLALINLYLNQPGLDLRKAEEHIEAMMRLDPVFGARGRSLQLGRKAADQQAALWKTVVADHPNRADAYAGLGQALYLQGQYKQAVEQFSKALDKDPGNIEVRFAMGRCYQATKELAPQAACYQQCLDMTPPAPLPSRLRAMRYLATAEEKRGNTQRAEALRKEADATDPRFGKRGAVRDDVPDLFTAP